MLGSFSGPASNSIIDPNLLASGQAKIEKSSPGYQKKIEGKTKAPRPRDPNLSLFWILSKWLILLDPLQHQPASFHGGPVALQARVPQGGLLCPSVRLRQTKTDRPQDIRIKDYHRQTKYSTKTTINQEGWQNIQSAEAPQASSCLISRKISIQHSSSPCQKVQVECYSLERGSAVCVPIQWLAPLTNTPPITPKVSSVWATTMTSKQLKRRGPRPLKTRTCIAQAQVAVTPPLLQAASSQKFQDT